MAIRRRRSLVALLIPLAALATACGADQSSAASDMGMSAAAHAHGTGHDISQQDQVRAMLANAGFQDVATAEAAGYKSSLDTLGCFQDPTLGGMGLHYINDSLMDGKVDITKPEALVYELGLDGKPIALVAHEYIVPIDKWTSKKPPRLFGMDFHRHPTLPLWVLHAWLWKPNPAGVFEDWNPAVRLCPPGVPIFGKDLPKS
jgi:hypothetical protein